jgi:hypothetical protein
MSTLQDLAMKVLSDPSFAQQLLANPEATLRAEGIEPTAEMLDALKGVDAASIMALAEDFKNGKAAT